MNDVEIIQEFIRNPCDACRGYRPCEQDLDRIGRGHAPVCMECDVEIDDFDNEKRPNPDFSKSS